MSYKKCLLSLYEQEISYFGVVVNYWWPMIKNAENRPLVAASLLSADFSQLAKDIKRVERAGADILHVDIMDGHFVPNITIGPVVVKYMRKVTKLPLDVHLMIKDPKKYLKPFVEAGSDMIAVHIEVVSLK